MRKILFLLFFVLSIVTLFSCSSNTNTEITTEETNEITSTPKPEVTPTQTQPVTPTPEGTPTTGIEDITPTPTQTVTPTLEATPTTGIEDITPTIPTEEPIETPEIDYTNSIFASSDGNGDGSLENPYSLTTALTKLNTKKTLYLLDGIYNVSKSISLTLSGSENNYYNIFALNDNVILDFGKDYTKEKVITNKYNSDSDKGIIIKGSYYYIKGLTIRNCGASGIHIRSSYNIIENCVLACNGNTGLNISGSSSSTIEYWPSYNLIKNCTSYGNYDWNRSDGNYGEDADGFGAKLCLGVGNIFDGCIAYNNSDDGWDLFTKHKTGPIGAVTIKNCVAFSNGYSLTGEELKNGNGFKLGGRAIEVSHVVDNCVAFYNKANGFDDNSNPGTLTITNCTSYKNGSKNFATGRFLEENNTYTSTWYEDEDLFGPIYNVPKSHNIFKNCISYAGSSSDTYSGTAENCYFYFNNNKYKIFVYLNTCNSKYAVGPEKTAFNPFTTYEIELDLNNIHTLFRNEDGTVNLKGFLGINSDLFNLNIGANL